MAVAAMVEDNLEQETVKWCHEILRNSLTTNRVLKSALNAVDDGHPGLQAYLKMVMKCVTYHVVYALLNPSRRDEHSKYDNHLSPIGKLELLGFEIT